MSRDVVDPPGAPPEEAARYSLSGGLRFDWTSATRHEGRDLQLDRPVRAWILDAAIADPRHAALLDVARAASRLTSPAFLRVVDALPEAERLIVILEAPEPSTASLPDGDEHELVREVTEGLREARTSGLTLHRLPDGLFEHRLRLDPVELFLPPNAPSRRDGSQGAAELRAALVEAVGRRTVPSGSALALLEERWRRASGHPAPESYESVLDELERASRLGTPPASAWPPTLDVPAGVFVSDEPTLPLELPPDAGMTRSEEPLASLEVSPSPSPPRPLPTRPLRPGRQLGVPLALGTVGVLTAATVLALSVGAFGQRSAAPPTEPTASTSEQAQPQAVPGQVLVVLRAQEDTYVRATVDGTVLFDGTMRSGESKSWQGRQRVQVFTNKGRTALLSINGYELGPYSPAMGHPDWNQIDFGFGPDWRP